jgi:hypothetical protein
MVNKRLSEEQVAALMAERDAEEQQLRQLEEWAAERAREGAFDA